jgi:hypothetical protein
MRVKGKADLKLAPDLMGISKLKRPVIGRNTHRLFFHEAVIKIYHHDSHTLFFKCLVPHTHFAGEN